MGSPILMKKKPSFAFAFARETAIQEVLRGRELAARLQALLSLDPRRELVHGLMEEVFHSFTRALSHLNPTAISKPFQEPPSMDRRLPFSANKGTEKVKTCPLAKGVQHHSRRRHLHSWTSVTSAPHHDGHEWRKYGQKNIQSSDFPRSYYRCTHRDDQGCLAAKLVQQKDWNDPPMFEVTYITEHTCRKSLPISQLPIKCSPSEPCMLSFGSDCSGIKRVQSFLTSFDSKGEGHKGDDAISPKFDAWLSSNYAVSPDLAALNSSDTTGDMLSGMSLSPNSDGFDQPLLMDPWNLDEDFGFDDLSFFEV